MQCLQPITSEGDHIRLALKNHQYSTGTSQLLDREGIKSAVVSLPCWEVFEKQTNEYKDNVLGNGLKVAIEAGCELGWHKYIGSNGLFIGMNTFGSSAPAKDLYKFFGFDPENIKKRVKNKLK